MTVDLDGLGEIFPGSARRPCACEPWRGAHSARPNHRLAMTRRRTHVAKVWSSERERDQPSSRHPDRCSFYRTPTCRDCFGTRLRLEQDARRETGRRGRRRARWPYWLPRRVRRDPPYIWILTSDFVLRTSGSPTCCPLIVWYSYVILNVDRPAISTCATDSIATGTRTPALRS